MNRTHELVDRPFADSRRDEALLEHVQHVEHLPPVEDVRHDEDRRAGNQGDRLGGGADVAGDVHRAVRRADDADPLSGKRFGHAVVGGVDIRAAEIVPDCRIVQRPRIGTAAYDENIERLDAPVRGLDAPFPTRACLARGDPDHFALKPDQRHEAEPDGIALQVARHVAVVGNALHVRIEGEILECRELLRRVDMQIPVDEVAAVIVVEDPYASCDRADLIDGDVEATLFHRLGADEPRRPCADDRDASPIRLRLSCSLHRSIPSQSRLVEPTRCAIWFLRTSSFSFSYPSCGA